MIIIPDAPPDASPDAFEPTFNLGCVGNTQGAAAANVTLSGFAAEVVLSGVQPDIVPAHNATVQVCKASSTTCTNTDQLFTFTTPMNGCPATGCPFTSSSLATGGTALDVYAKVSKGTGPTANWTTYIYPAAPIIANVSNAPGVMFTDGVVSALSLAGIVTQDPNKAMMLVAVLDCADMPITDTANLNLMIKQGGTAVAGTTLFDASQLDPTLAGTFAVFNVPTGDVATPTSVVTEVAGTYKTTTLRAHSVRVFPGGTTGTQLRPGF